MSLAIDLTRCQERLLEAEQKASAEARLLKAVAPPAIYNELMLQLCVVAACGNDLKTILGAMRMCGDLEQRPAEVTAETLELGRYAVPMGLCEQARKVKMWPERGIEQPPPREVWKLRAAADGTLAVGDDEPVIDQNVSVEDGKGVAHA